MVDTLVRLSDLKPAPAHIIGPTWQRRRDGRWHLPKASLGWGILDWLAEYVRSPGGDNDDDPFIPTSEQARFILWWYAVDELGRFAYRNGVLRRMKGWGKDPLVAALSLVELCGPARFSHWENSRPVGKRVKAPWIQIAAVSLTQTGNTLKLFPSMVSPKLKEEFKLDINKTIIHSTDGSGGLIEGVTSSPATLEGGRPTFVILNEIQEWIETNDGHAMYGVVEGNITKSRMGVARYLAICNAHVPGKNSIGERMWDSYVAVQTKGAVDTGILYDALEAPAETPVSEIPSEDVDPEGFELGLKMLKDGLTIARGDAYWLDIDTIVGSILDINNPISESRRKFLNHINAAEDAWIAPHEWDRILKDATLEPGDTISLGFDGSKSGDFTALVACRIDDGLLVPIKVWDPEKYGGEIPREDVDATVHWVFSRFNVVAFRADVKEFESYVDAWSRQYKKKLKVKASPNNLIAFDMRGQTKRFALDCEKLNDAVLEGAVSHNGSAILRQHVLNAHRNPTTYDAISIRKASKDSSRKIDAAVCAVLAFAGRQEYLMNKKNRTGKVAVFR